MSGKPSIAAVVFVSDVPRLRDFYRDVIGLTVTVDERGYAVLETAGFELVIHGLPNEPIPESTTGEPPSIREDCYLKLCLPVNSISEARSIAERLGGRIKDSTHEWNGRSYRACDGHDPEGNVFQVRENSA